MFQHTNSTIPVILTLSACMEQQTHAHPSQSKKLTAFDKNIRKLTLAATNTLPSTSAPPPPHHAVFAATDELTRRTMLRRPRPPRDAPYFTGLLNSRYSGTSAEVPHLDSLVGGPSQIGDTVSDDESDMMRRVWLQLTPRVLVCRLVRYPR